MKISFYKSVRENKAHHIEAERLYHAVTAGAWKQQVEAIRSEKNEAKQKAMKTHLPGVRMSGTFSSNNDDSLISHSGLICLDFDEKENPGITDWSDFRDWIGNLEDVAFAALSVRGQGVFAVVQTDPIPTCKEEHLAFFNTLSNYFESVSIKVDESAKNVGRFRFVSYDPDAVLNTKARVFKDIIQPDKSIAPHSYNNISHSNSGINTPFTRMIDKVIHSRTDITGGYHKWFALGCCLAANMGENGRAAFHQISQFSPLYDSKKTDFEYNKILRKNYMQTPPGYLFKVAKEHEILLKQQ